MSENWSKLILKTVSEGVGVTSDLIVSMLEAGYGASHKQLQKKFKEAQDRRLHFFDESYAKERRKLSNLISKLKREDLIRKEGGSWALTKFGVQRLAKSRAILPKRDYQKQDAKTFKIIVFDVPEKFRSKRAWLRDGLNRLGFVMLQKSVWYGKFALPEEFIAHIDEMELGEFVQILEITKGGSVVEL